MTDLDEVGEPLHTPTNPYVGPRSIRYGEPIYGRDRELDELRDILIAERIVLFYSPSGAGKSSLLEAGLRPDIERHGFRVLPTIRVGHDLAGDDPGGPNRYLLSTLVSLEESRPIEQQRSPEELALSGLDAYLTTIAGEGEPGLDPCLFFDQFEELFTLDPTDPDAKHAFMDEVGVALRDRGLWALFSMREDFIAQLDPYLGLIPTRFSARYRLDLLGTEAAKAAVRRPAEAAGVEFTDAAADRLIDDLRRVRVQRGTAVVEELGPYVEPVQLQVVCRKLWSSLYE
jgi:hypothetical protein